LKIEILKKFFFSVY